jgi:hypothetical protein
VVDYRAGAAAPMSLGIRPARKFLSAVGRAGCPPTQGDLTSGKQERQVFPPGRAIVSSAAHRRHSSPRPGQLPAHRGPSDARPQRIDAGGQPQLGANPIADQAHIPLCVANARQPGSRHRQRVGCCHCERRRDPRRGGPPRPEDPHRPGRQDPIAARINAEFQQRGDCHHGNTQQ